MIRAVLAVLVAVLAPSCATKNDVQEVQWAFQENSRETQRALEDFRNQAITQDELSRRLADADAKTAGTIEQVRERIVDRVDDVTAQVTSYQGVTGNPLMDLVIGGVAAVTTGGGAYVATNRARDRRRRDRGEVVGHQYAPAAYGAPPRNAPPDWQPSPPSPT